MSDVLRTPSEADPHADAVRLLIDGDTAWDRRLITASSWLNPILVKETRQALKSKQFVWTFLLLIVVAVAWTLIAIVSSLPNIYYDSDGSIFLFGYLTMLLFPSMLVIPQATFRSMASELEDGTFETLTLSLLSSRQVVYGKLCVAVLQLILYLSILAPCISLTYLLQGVTLEVIATVLMILSGSSLSLCALSIFFASLSKTRMLQVIYSVVMIGVQLTVALTLLFSFVPMLREPTFGRSAWGAIALFLFALAGYSWLLLRIAASAIDMPSANRTTPIRYALFIVGTSVSVAWIFFFLMTPDETGTFVTELAAVIATFSWTHWGIAGSWMMGERGIISNRARRTLPDTFFQRLFLTWFNPGAGPAYIFVVLSFSGPWIAFTGMQLMLRMFGQIRTSNDHFEDFVLYVVALAAYLAFYLGMTRLVLLVFFRKVQASRLLLSFAIVFVLLLVFVVASLFLSLAAGNYRDMDFNSFCFVNPFWTLAELFPSSYGGVFIDPEMAWAMLMLLGCSALVFVINVVFAARDVMITRLETPPRVLAERPNKDRSQEPNSPWDPT